MRASVLILTVLVLGGCRLEKTIGPGDDRMPSVVGKTATRANIALNSRGFSPSYGTQVPFDSDRCRVVVQKSPPGSKVRPFSTQQVRCVVRVPDLVGRTGEQAESALEDQGLDPKFPGGHGLGHRGRCRVTARTGGQTARPQTDIHIRLRC